MAEQERTWVMKWHWPTCILTAFVLIYTIGGAAIVHHTLTQNSIVEELARKVNQDCLGAIKTQTFIRTTSLDRYCFYPEEKKEIR